jgi:hypothetical protein
MFKLKLFIGVIFSSVILLFQTCSDKAITNQNPSLFKSQLIVSPSNFSAFKQKDTVHFVLLTDTLQPVQVLSIVSKNGSPLSPRIFIAHIGNFSQIDLGDTATTRIIGTKDTLDSCKVIRLNWQIPDTLEGSYAIWFYHYDPGTDTNAIGKLQITITQ